jgi:hypothetical protein
MCINLILGPCFPNVIDLFSFVFFPPLLFEWCKVVSHFFAFDVFSLLFACTFFVIVTHNFLSFLPLVLPFLQHVALISLLLLFHEELFSMVICCFIIALFPSIRIHLLHCCRQTLCTSFFSLIIIHEVQGLSISFGLWCVFYVIWIHSFCCCYFVKNNLH